MPANDAIVEDNDLLRSIMKGWREGEGDTSVVTCQTFDEAEVVMKSMTPDVLITDVRLGDFNGIQLGLLTRHSNPPSRDRRRDRVPDPVLCREVNQFGAEFLLKPLTRKTLLGAIRGSESRDQRT
jgi:DNA-binding response OmpR family regulator